MKPDTLEPLTVSPDTNILMDRMQELQKDIRALAPLLDLLRTPQGQEEQEMIRRLLALMANVDAHLASDTDRHQAVEKRQARIEETQGVILQQLVRLERKVTDLHRGVMPLVTLPDTQGG